MVLPYINTNPPRVYTCSPSWTPLPPPSPYHPSGSSQCTSPEHPVSCIEPGLAIRFTYDIIHIGPWFLSILCVLVFLCGSQTPVHLSLTPLTCDRLCALWRSVRAALQLCVLWAQHGRGAGIFPLPLPLLPILLCCLSPKADLCITSVGSSIPWIPDNFGQWTVLVPFPPQKWRKNKDWGQGLYSSTPPCEYLSGQVCTPTPGHCPRKGRALLDSLLPGLRAVRSLGPSGLGAHGFTAANPGARHHLLCVITLCLHLPNLPLCK